MKTFAEFVRDARLNAGYTLRSFCKEIGEDPSNWSKVERELLKPPRDQDKLASIAIVLGFNYEDAEFQLLFDLAAAAFIPKGLVEEKILDQLPLLFRTVRGEEPTNEELEKLAEKIKAAWIPAK
ncbi:hypothetical protein ES705_16622 [subsurface metagenome]